MTHNMNIEQAKLLLTRFYEGKTTPAEERLLAEFLRSDDVPEEFNADRQLFMQLSEIADTPMPNDIAEQIKTFVGNLTDHNNNTTQIETRQKQGRKRSQGVPVRSIIVRQAHFDLEERGGSIFGWNIFHNITRSSDFGVRSVTPASRKTVRGEYGVCTPLRRLPLKRKRLVACRLRFGQQRS